MQHYFLVSDTLKFNTPPNVMADNAIVRFMPIMVPLQRTTIDFLQ